MLADHRVKLKESEKKDKYIDIARELKKMWNMKVTFTSIVTDTLGHRRINKETRRFGNKRTSEDHSFYSIFEIGHNTEKSPGDLKRFAVIQTPEKDDQLM